MGKNVMYNMHKESEAEIRKMNNFMNGESFFKKQVD